MWGSLENFSGCEQTSKEMPKVTKRLNVNIVLIVYKLDYLSEMFQVKPILPCLGFKCEGLM